MCNLYLSYIVTSTAVMEQESNNFMVKG